MFVFFKTVTVLFLGLGLYNVKIEGNIEFTNLYMGFAIMFQLFAIEYRIHERN